MSYLIERIADRKLCCCGLGFFLGKDRYGGLGWGITDDNTFVAHYCIDNKKIGAFTATASRSNFKKTKKKEKTPGLCANNTNPG